MLSKFSDVCMLYETIIFECYNICPIYEKDTVIDIGAHIGGFSTKASKIAFRGKVYSYEAYDETFSYLKENARLNERENLSVFNLSVGNTTAKKKLYIHKNLAENTLYRKSDIAHEVRGITLAKIFSDNRIDVCDVLKLDCEGSEYEILFSSKEQLIKTRRIIFEYHEPKYFGLSHTYNLADLIEFLKDISFQIKLLKTNHYQGIIFAQNERYLTQNGF